MKRFLIVVAMLFATNVFALSSDTVSSAGFDKLSESQKAEILHRVAQQAEANKAEKNPLSSAASVDKAERWVGVGERIGKAMGGAAREIGVAANEFAMTPVGMLTMGLIVWHLLGGMIVHVFGGILVIVVGLAMVLLVMRRTYPVTYVYDAEKTNVFGNRIVNSKHRDGLSTDAAIGFTIASAIVLVAGMICIFTF